MHVIDEEKARRSEALFAEAEQAAREVEALERQIDELKQRATSERETYTRCRKEAIELLVPAHREGFDSPWVR